MTVRPNWGPEQVRDLRQRHTQVRVQPHDQRDDFGTELHAGRSQRVGGLQSVAALDATPTLRAVADLDVEAPHDGAHHREIFLILRRHPGQLDGAAAVRTRGSHRRSAGLVNLRRTRAARLPAVVRTCAPAGSSAATLGPVLGEGSRLPESCPPRRVELLLEVFTAALPPIPVTLPPIPVALDPRQLLAQSCDLSLLFLNAGIAGILLRPGTLPWHPTVMPDPLEKYKSKMLDLARHETTPLNKYPRQRPEDTRSLPEWGRSVDRRVPHATTRNPQAERDQRCPSVSGETVHQAHCSIPGAEAHQLR